MPPTPFSLRRLDELLPDGFSHWVKWACAMAVIGYGTIVVLDLQSFRAQNPLGLLGEALALVMALVALATTLRGWPAAGALTLILAVGAEIHWAVFLDGSLGRGGALVLPVLLLAGGALMGGVWPFVLAAVGAVTLPLAVFAGGLRAGDGWGALSAELGSLVVLVLALATTAVLLYQALRAFESVLALAEARRRRVEDLIRHAPDALLVLDDDARIQVANPAAERLFGRLQAELRHHPLQGLGLIPAPDLGGGDDTRRDGLERVLTGNPTPLLLALDADGDGASRRMVEVTSRRTGPQGQVTVQLRDVTDRVEADAERREMEYRLQHAHRLQAVAVLAGGVAHDFHNIFTVVRGVAELLQLEDDAELRELAVDLTRAQERGSLLTGKLLTFAQRTEADPRPLSLAAVVHEGADFFRSVLGDGARLEFRLESHGRVRMDPHQPDQILTHLLSNAHDAGAEKVTLSLRDEAGEVVLGVEDDGRGMDPWVRDRMFDPFFTTKPVGSGSGLGLSTVLGIVHGYGGRVVVDSAPGRGTTVEVRLPRENEAEESAGALGSSPPGD